MTKDNLQIYNALLREIITMQIKPGTMLREIDIAARFNVSRTPIRDVFKKLEADGLLVILSQKGSYVSRISLEGINDIMYIRSQVEKSVMVELMSVVTPGDIARFRMIVSDQEGLLSTYNENGQTIEALAEKFFDLDNIFHENIYRRVGKESVLKIINEMDPSFSRYRYLTFLRDRNALEELCRLHGQMVDCLERRDLEELQKVVRNHNFSGINGLEAVKLRHPNYFND